jgi:hypothetical protein
VTIEVECVVPVPLALGTAMQTLRIVTLRFGTGDREWSLNDGPIPNPNVVRVAPVRGTTASREIGGRRETAA